MLRSKQLLTRPFTWIALLAVLALGAPAHADPIAADPLDCEGPPIEAAEGTPEYQARDVQNMFCSEQRHLDQAQHPVMVTPSLPTSDAYRAPQRHDGSRFRFTATSVGSIAAEVYRPCAEGTCPNLASGVPTFEPPYPAVVILHGGASRKEYHWWSAQPLAEQGYLVVSIDSTGNADQTLTWLLDPSNPFADDLDRDRIGIAGHSTGGGSAFARQGDPRVSAIVAWDGGSNSAVEPGHVTPTLFLRSDGGGGLAYPTPRILLTGEVAGYENQRRIFDELRDNDVDTMVVVGRATNHIDFVGGELMGNRLAELVWIYYDLAWFDRYLKGKFVLTGTESPEEEAAERAHREAIARDAFDRLTATRFDDSADVTNISQGFWDPQLAVASGDVLYGGNVPYAIEDKDVANRLSFYHRSLCFVSSPDYGAGSIAARADTTPDGDMRTDGCPATI